jgi:DNA-binding transcriptional MerR regulator
LSADIDRLQQVLTYRRLGFGLEEIAALIDDAAVDAVEHLRRQRDLLTERGAEFAAMVAAIDMQLEARTIGMKLTPEEQLEGFGTDKVGREWADEACERWGETRSYKESQRRAASYTKADWEALKVESDDGLRNFVAAMAAGEPADGETATRLAEEHRAFLTK